jgi:hypothetical protein
MQAMGQPDSPPADEHELAVWGEQVEVGHLGVVAQVEFERPILKPGLIFAG